MTSRNQKSTSRTLWLAGLSLSFLALAPLAQAELRFIQVQAKDKYERSKIADLGISIEAVRSDSIWGFADSTEVAQFEKSGFKILGNFDPAVALPPDERNDAAIGAKDFPPADSRYHNYAELTAALKNLQSKHAAMVKVVSIGRSVEGREIWALHINSTPDSLRSGKSTKPAAVIMGAHHAREHLSVEVPLMLAQHLLENESDPKISALLDGRDIWIIPMVNPDGAEWDITPDNLHDKYKYWRKNRRKNDDGSFGVDLNRNYGFKWGQGGSSKDPKSDTYMGDAAFSEPETRAIRDFVNSHPNLKTLLTFHSFSELVLYPWGATHDAVGKAKDFAVFKNMAETMAGWNKYKAEQSSELYITTGDTTDWAYAEHGIFAFTIELSPAQFGDGGFYPGSGMIDKAFADNLKPSLYLIDLADDPYRAVDTEPKGWLKHYVSPGLSESLMWEEHPLPLQKF